MWATLAALTPWPSSWGAAAAPPGVPTHQQHGAGHHSSAGHRGSVTRTKMAASYEALLTGGEASGTAVAAGLALPSLVLSDAWACPPWWDEHLLLKARLTGASPASLACQQPPSDAVPRPR